MRSGYGKLTNNEPLNTLVLIETEVSVDQTNGGSERSAIWRKYLIPNL